MTKELIRITERDGKQAVSARELHKVLEIGTKFNDWIFRMLDYGFEENLDYSKLSIENQAFNYDFVLTIECAKEIAMIQRTEIGKEVRKYFIECERRLKNPLQNISRIDLAKLIIESEEENQRLQLEMKEQEPMVVFAKALQVSRHNILIGELAKILKQNEIKIGQNRLFIWLRDNNFLMSRGEQKNLPTQRALELGLFEVKTTVINNPDGSVRVTKTTKVTPKGQEYFINKFLKLQDF